LGVEQRERLRRVADGRVRVRLAVEVRVHLDENVPPDRGRLGGRRGGRGRRRVGDLGDAGGAGAVVVPAHLAERVQRRLARGRADGTDDPADRRDDGYVRRADLGAAHRAEVGGGRVVAV